MLVLECLSDCTTFVIAQLLRRFAYVLWRFSYRYSGSPCSFQRLYLINGASYDQILYFLNIYSKLHMVFQFISQHLTLGNIERSNTGDCYYSGLQLVNLYMFIWNSCVGSHMAFQFIRNPYRKSCMTDQFTSKHWLLMTFKGQIKVT